MPLEQLVADFVVVDAVPVGCVLARRLTEAAGTRVILIEAGEDDINRWTRVPLRVVEASIMFSLRAENTTAPTIAISEEDSDRLRRPSGPGS